MISDHIYLHFDFWWTEKNSWLLSPTLYCLTAALDHLYHTHMIKHIVHWYKKVQVTQCHIAFCKVILIC